MPLVVPLAAEPAQEVRVTLAGQLCRARVLAREVEVPVLEPGQISTDPPVYVATRLVLFDLYVNDALVVGGVRCYDRNRLVRDAYLGFDGDLAFYDAFGTTDPWYTELGTRFFLLYFSVTELA